MELKKYSRDYEIGSHHCNMFAELNLSALLLFLQDAANKHASLLNYDYDFCRKNNLAWVLIKYDVEIEEMPSLLDIIKITTHPSGIKKLFARRDFIVEKNDKVIIRAASQWLIIDTIKHCPVSIYDYNKDFQFIDEYTLETKFSKILKPEKLDEQKKFPVIFTDIDVNKHMNNTQYVNYAYNSFSSDWLHTHTFKRLEMQFKEESFLDDVLTYSVNIQDNTAVQIAENQEGKEVFIMRTTFEKK